ncbi:hypothetical protein HDU81_002856 [Chytriomyces hyalinus]|nr:hypothetical protein HDU81_002856 [Chytriomyces hyalinus]
MVYIGAVTVLLSAIHTATATAYKGRGEWTYTSNGIGACGTVRSDGDLTVSLSRSLFDKSIPDGNPNHAESCGRCIQIVSPASFQVTVADRCEGCAEDSLTFTPAGFALLDDINKGHVDIEWDWCNSTMPDVSQEDPSLIDPVMTTNEPILVDPVEANFETPSLITVASQAIDHLYIEYTDYATPSSSFSTTTTATTTTTTKTSPYIKTKCPKRSSTTRSLKRKKCHPKTKHSKTRKTSCHTHFATPSISSTVTTTFATRYIYQETATPTTMAQSTTTTTETDTASSWSSSVESCIHASSSTSTVSSETTRCHETTSATTEQTSVCKYTSTTTTTTTTHACSSEVSISTPSCISTKTVETTKSPTTTPSQTWTSCATAITTTLSSSAASSCTRATTTTTTTTRTGVSYNDDLPPSSSDTTASTVSTPPATMPEPSEIAGIACSTFKDSVCLQNVLYQCLGSDSVFRWYVVASC